MPEDNFEYWYKQGIGFSDLKKYGEALTCFEKAIELSSNNNELSDAWYMKGVSFGKQKKYFDAEV